MNTDRQPSHPGEVLRSLYLDPLKLTVDELGDRAFISKQYLFFLLDGIQPITPTIALKLARFFDNTPGFWLNLQNNYDLHRVQQMEFIKKELSSIVPYTKERA